MEHCCAQFSLPQAEKRPIKKPPAGKKTTRRGRAARLNGVQPRAEDEREDSDGFEFKGWSFDSVRAPISGQPALVALGWRLSDPYAAAHGALAVNGDHPTPFCVHGASRSLKPCMCGSANVLGVPMHFPEALYLSNRLRLTHAQSVRAVAARGDMVARGFARVCDRPLASLRLVARASADTENAAGGWLEVRERRERGGRTMQLSAFAILSGGLSGGSVVRLSCGSVGGSVGAGRSRRSRLLAAVGECGG